MGKGHVAFSVCFPQNQAWAAPPPRPQGLGEQESIKCCHELNLAITASSGKLARMDA